MPDYDPPNPVNDPDQKEKILLSLTPQEEIVLDTNYYLPCPINVSSYEENAPALVNNQVPEPTPEEEENSNINRQTRTKDKPAGEDKGETNEDKGEE